MKSKILILRYISAFLVAVALLSTVAFAAKDASKYIWITNISMVTSTPGVIEADCTVTATDIYDDVGIEWFEFHKADGTLVGKRHYFTEPGYSYLMGHDDSSHTVALTCPAEAGEKYYAKVCFYAGTYGVAGDGHTMGSAIVTAK